MSILSEFKQFAIKGDVIDLAVGFVVGAAFGVYEASMQPSGRVITHAAADRDPAASGSGTQLMAAGGRF